MAVRQDKVQIRIEFLTDEAKALAKATLDIQKMNKEVIDTGKANAKLREEIEELGKAANRTAEQETKLMALNQQYAENQKKIAENIRSIAAAGGDVSKIDLSKVTSQQLRDIKRILVAQKELTTIGSEEYQGLAKSIDKVNDQLAEVDKKTKGASEAHSRFQIDAGSAYTAVAAFTVAAISKIVEATSETNKLKNALIRAFNGDEIKASKLLAELRNLSSDIGVGINDVTEQFISLQNRGFAPTVESFKGLADVAAFSKKPIDQLVEAILDAQTGEFERLKEFGIKASKEGDNATLKFGAMSKTVALTGEGIKSFFNDLSKDSRVFGAAAEQANGFDGALNRLKNGFTQLFSNGGTVTKWITNLTDAFAKLVDKIADYGRENLAETVRKEQLEFQKSIQTLQDATASTNAKTKAIGFLTSHYPELVKNMNLEKASQAELNGLLAKGNAMYLEKISIAASQDKLLLIEKQFSEVLKDEEEIRDRLAVKRQGIGKGKNPLTEESAAITQDKKLLESKQTLLLAYEELRKEENQRIENRKKRLKDLFGIVDEEVKIEDAGNKGKAKSAKQLAAEAAKAKKDQLNLALKQVEFYYQKESLLNDLKIQQQELKDKKEIILKLNLYEKQTEIYNEYLNKQKKGSEIAIETQIKLLEIEKKVTEEKRKLYKAQAIEQLPPENSDKKTTANSEEKLYKIKELSNAEKNIVLDKFEQLIITEQDFNLKIAEIRKNEANSRLLAIAENNAAESEELKKAYAEKLAADEYYSRTLKDNEQRTIDFKEKIRQQELQLAGEALDIAIQFLSKDEEARKKNAGAIKAFGIAKATVNYYTELSEIWKYANSSAANIIPGAGNIIGGIQAALATARLTLTLQNISSQKFAQGGALKLGQFGGKPHAQGGTKGYFDDGTAVEVEAGETFAIINKKNTPLLKMLSGVNAYAGNGIPFFEKGGTLFNTTPTFTSLPNISYATQNSYDDSRMVYAIGKLSDEVKSFEGRLRVVYQDVKSVEVDYDTTTTAANF